MSTLEVFDTVDGIVTKDKKTNDTCIYKFTNRNNDPKNMVTYADDSYVSSSEDESEDDNEIDLKNVNINIDNPEVYDGVPTAISTHHDIFDKLSVIIKSVHVDGSDIQCKEQRMIEMDIGNRLLNLLIKNNIITVVTEGSYLLFNFNLKNNCFYLELMPDISKDNDVNKRNTTYSRSLDIETASNGKYLNYNEKTPDHHVEVLCAAMDLSGIYDMSGNVELTNKPESCLCSIIFDEKYIDMLELDDIKRKADELNAVVREKQVMYDSSTDQVNSYMKEKLKIEKPDPVMEKFLREYKKESQ